MILVWFVLFGYSNISKQVIISCEIRVEIRLEFS